MIQMRSSAVPVVVCICGIIVNDKDDSTPVPVDPRTLVQPGVSDGKAVHFNAYWAECHADPEAVQEYGNPETCGEVRDFFYRGENC